MNLVAAAALGSLALLLAPLRSAPDATFTTAPQVAGAKAEFTSGGSMAMKMSVKMGKQELQKMELKAMSRSTGVVTAEKADAAGVTDAKIAFGACTKVDPNPFGEAGEQPGPCSDKKYAVTKGAAGWDVKGADGSAPAKEEMDEIRPLLDHFLAAPPLAATLGGKSVKPGEKVDVPSADAKRLLANVDEEMTIKNCALTLDSERKEGTLDVALFKMAATMSAPASETNPMEMTVDFSGDVVVAKGDCRVISMKVTGPLKANGAAGPGMTMEGSGDYTIEITFSR